MKLNQAGITLPVIVIIGVLAAGAAAAIGVVVYNVVSDDGNGGGASGGDVGNSGGGRDRGGAIISDISVWGRHTCAIIRDGLEGGSDGTVRCWGWGDEGQLGNGANASSSTPVEVVYDDDGDSATPHVPLSGVVQIAVGFGHTCAVIGNEPGGSSGEQTRGEVRCWGAGSGGLLGNGATDNSPTPVAVVYDDDGDSATPHIPLSGVVQIAAGRRHTCAVIGNEPGGGRASGEVRCWGNGFGRQLGNGGTASSSTPVAVVGIDNAVQVSAGRSHTCAVIGGGEIRCWGTGGGGELGDGRTASSSTPVAVVGINNAVQVSAGRRYTCAIIGGGEVQCWGAGGGENSGNSEPDSSSESIPQAVPGITNAIQISAGRSHTCAVIGGEPGDGSGGEQTRGEIRCWGEGNSGQLGNGGTDDSDTPVTVLGISNALQVAAGRSHTCAVIGGGSGGGAAGNQIRCWGFGGEGQLGNGITINSSAPLNVSGISNAMQVSAGRSHTCAVIGGGGQAAGDRTGGGGDGSGSGPGDGSGGGTGGGGAARGSVRCWGWGSISQLGEGMNASSPAPAMVPDITNARQVSAGGFNACTVVGSRSGDEVRCWEAGPSRPVSVPRTSNAIQVSEGDLHTCAIIGSGVRCWGAGFEGQLGNGAADSSSTPVDVVGISNATQVSAGFSHSCAIIGGTEDGRAEDGRTGGEIRCWGNGRSGQLGNGTEESSSVPVTVLYDDDGNPATPDVPLSDVVQVSAGDSHTCAIIGNTSRSGADNRTGNRSAEGRILCWGAGRSGQLGDGAAETSLIPVAVLYDDDDNPATPDVPISNAVQVSAGGSHNCAVIGDRQIESRILCWGLGRSGQLGNGRTDGSPIPVAVLYNNDGNSATPDVPLSDAVQVSAGGNHTCAIIDSGEVWCWGAGSGGQLGTGDPLFSAVPIPPA